MKTSFLPKTLQGKTSVVLFIFGIVLGGASNVISSMINNQIEYPNPLNSPLLGSFVYLTFAAFIVAAWIGLGAVMQKKERAISVYMIIPPGILLFLVILIFFTANLVGPPSA